MSVYLTDHVKHGEYIDFGESWLVCLSEGELFKLEDREVNLYGSPKQEFVAPNTVIYNVQRFPKELSHYEDEGGNLLSKEKYNEIYGAYYDETAYEYYYPDLDTEFAHRKELEKLKDYKQVFIEKEDILTPVELICKGKAEDTGNPFIKTALAYGKGGFGNSGFYEVDWRSVTTSTFYKFINDNGLQDLTVNTFGRPYVRFAQVEGKYVVGDNILGNGSKESKSVFSCLESAELAIEKHVKDFNTHLKIKIFGDKEVLDGVTVKEMYEALESISRQVNNLDVKQKSKGSKYTIQNTIKGVMEKFKKGQGGL